VGSQCFRLADSTHGKRESKTEWERLIDEKFSPKLLRSLASPGIKGAKSLLVKCQGEEIVFQPSNTGKEKGA